MANLIEFNTNVKADEFVAKTSRYIESRVVYYSEAKILTFETYKKKPILISPNDQVTVIPPGMEYRPDLISKGKYGTVDFWWKIMEANKMKDIMEFTAGKTITLPENIYA
jgi:hypothetical protein